MSDTQQGPGWWLASDGKWYPPETAPGASTDATSTDGGAGWAAPSDSSPSDFSPDPGAPVGAGVPPAFGTAPAYGQPSYGAPMAPQNNSGATTSLVLGIVSVVFCGLFTGIPAIITGRKARKEIAASGGQQSGDGMALTGLILGIVGTALSVLGILFFILVIALGSAADDEIRFDDDLGEINSDPSDGDCDESRFLQDPDC
jgi:hypothetical protein